MMAKWGCKTLPLHGLSSLGDWDAECAEFRGLFARSPAQLFLVRAFSKVLCELCEVCETGHVGLPFRPISLQPSTPRPCSVPVWSMTPRLRSRVLNSLVPIGRRALPALHQSV